MKGIGSGASLVEPCEDADSCLAEKLGALAPLSANLSDLLADLEKERRGVSRGEIIFQAGEPTKNLYVLKKGWVVSEAFNARGVRSIVRVHHPGDIIGASQIPYAMTPYRGLAKSDAVICPFPRQRLDDVFRASPRLAALLLTIAMIESAEQEDRASVFRRNDAVAKLALFVQQTFGRLRLMNQLLHDRFHCPLTQADIGDVIGMTSVHVSRTFSRLEQDGCLTRHGQFIHITDNEALSAHTGYIDRYHELDLSWIPAA